MRLTPLARIVSTGVLWMVLAGCAGLAPAPPSARPPPAASAPTPTPTASAQAAAEVLAASAGPGGAVQPPADAAVPSVRSGDAQDAASGVQAGGVAVPPDAAASDVIEAPVVIDPVRPEVRLDPNEFEVRRDLWERVRNGFAMPDLESELTREREKWYASRPDYFQRMTERGSRYLFHIVEEVERRRLPTELALLPFIESAFNPQAMSSAKASGMWQFIPSTGKNFDLKQNFFRDDRRDVLASTRAALDYLQKLHTMFGDWHLALAAYNWGEGSVGRAIARNKKAGLATDYASLKMPDETRHYVPKLQAVKNLIHRPTAFGIDLPQLSNHPYFLSVAIGRDMDVDVAARLSGMDPDDFRALNPQMNKPVILAAGTPQVLLPYDNANQFVRQLALHRGPLASWTAWVAPRTLRPAEAARLVGMSEDSLREVNRIPPRMLVTAGSTLLVPRARHGVADVPVHLADNAMMALVSDGPVLRKLSLRAGRNDSVASVARRYRVSPAQVGQWNSVGSAARFKAGETIVVFVPAKSTAAKAPATGGGVAKTRSAKAAPSVKGASKTAAKSPSTQKGTAAGKRHVRVARQ